MPDMYKKTNELKIPSKRAFTLAEILIVLAIIGIASALTIPSVIAKFQDSSLESEYKKTKNIVSSGYGMMLGQNQVFSVYELPFVRCGADANCYADYHREVFSVMEDSAAALKPENMPSSYLIKDSETPSSFSWADVSYMFATTDGTVYGVTINNALKSIDVVADVNGFKAPNTVEKDFYKFRIAQGGNVSDVSSELKN